MRNGLLTVSEVARAARVTVQAVYRWIWDGKLPAKRIGGSWRIEVTDWDRFSGKVTAGDARTDSPVPPDSPPAGE